MCEEMRMIESCQSADAGIACVCSLLTILLLVTATGTILRLSATGSVILFLRLAWRAAHRRVVLWSTTA